MSYKLCKGCDQPMLKKGQKRKHPDEYRHAQGCPLEATEMVRVGFASKIGINGKGE